LQPEEVHLNQANRLNDVSIILGNQQIVAAGLILDVQSGANLLNVSAPIITPAGMDANLSVGILQLLAKVSERRITGSPFSNASFSSAHI
jgi:hypothetical protein